MTPIELLHELDFRNIKLGVRDEKLITLNDSKIPESLLKEIGRNKNKIIAALKPITPTEPSSRQELDAMLKRLECGECSAVRIYAHNLRAEVWFVRDDVVMESDRVTFTLSELKKLAGVSTEHLKKVYLIKKEFGAKVVDNA